MTQLDCCNPEPAPPLCHWDPENLIACTRPNLAEVCYSKLDLTPKVSPYPRVAIFQKLLRSRFFLLLNQVVGKLRFFVHFSF